MYERGTTPNGHTTHFLAIAILGPYPLACTSESVAPVIANIENLPSHMPT